MSLRHRPHPLDFLPHGHRERRRQRRGLALGALVFATAIASGFSAIHLAVKADAKATRRLARIAQVRQQADQALARVAARAARIEPLLAEAAAWKASRAESVAGLLLDAVLPDDDSQSFTLDWTEAPGAQHLNRPTTGSLTVTLGAGSTMTDWTRQLAKSSLVESTLVIDAATLHASINATTATTDRLLQRTRGPSAVADANAEAR